MNTSAELDKLAEHGRREMNRWIREHPYDARFRPATLPPPRPAYGKSMTPNAISKRRIRAARKANP